MRSDEDPKRKRTPQSVLSRRKTIKFEFHNPTQLIFGAGTLSQLGDAVRKHGKKALVVTGGGSVKRNAKFDRAVASLKAAGVSVAECSGLSLRLGGQEDLL